MMSIDDCQCDIFDAPGYTEGYSLGYSILFHTKVPNGKEVTYDFATMERAIVTYKDTPLFIHKDARGEPDYDPPGYGTGVLEGFATAYFANLYGFENTDGIEADYSGRFEGMSAGANTAGLEVGSGVMSFWSHGGDDGTGELEVYGFGQYLLLGLGLDLPLPPISVSLIGTTYDLKEVSEIYAVQGPSGMYVPRSEMERMNDDIRSGKYSPVRLLTPFSAIENVFATVHNQNNWDKHHNYFLYEYNNCFWNEHKITEK
jgi:hypothetical protein